MTYDEIAMLQPGDTFSLNLYDLWTNKYGAQRKECVLDIAGWLVPSPDETVVPQAEQWDYPYIDVYMPDASRIACDREEVKVVRVDGENMYVELIASDPLDDYVFKMSFDDLSYSER